MILVWDDSGFSDFADEDYAAVAHLLGQHFAVQLPDSMLEDAE